MGWTPTIILAVIGFFFVIMTYISVIKQNNPNAGIVGGVLIFAAFIISPIKWLAVLALLD